MTHPRIIKFLLDLNISIIQSKRLLNAIKAGEPECFVCGRILQPGEIGRCEICKAGEE